MPWRARSAMDERLQFISDYQRQLFTLTELCDRHGVSLKTGYQLSGALPGLEGAAGLSPRSSRPHHSPQTTAQGRLRARLWRSARRHPRWGGNKIVAVLQERYPTWALPAVSTANDILKRHGFVHATRQSATDPAPSAIPPSVVTDSNRAWTVDFKRQFRIARWLSCVIR